ncbi:MAG: alanine--tRNA ligase [Patescibacteria group bacterium]
MTPNELRQKYLNFFQKNGHAIVPSSPLVPDNDPTTLFTGSGMQPMVPYLLGQKHQLGTRIVDSQKCFRSQDIEEVGDNRHTTFFEMLGNWSLGDYFKKEQLTWFFTFLTDKTDGMGLDPNRLFVTVFRGAPEIDVPKDTESVEIWKQLFKEKNIEAQDVDFAEKDGMKDGRIFYYDAKKNWWSRAGVPSNMPVGEPGGPDSEVFYDFGVELKLHENSQFKDEPCHVNCDCGRFMEIGNSVFMEYVKTDNGFEKLSKPNVDFGGGLERILAPANNEIDVFRTDAFQPIVKVIEKISGVTYGDDEVHTRSFRVISDHMRAAVMLASDGIFPSNKAQGYFSRRLVRRSIRYAKMIGIENPFVAEIVKAVSSIYAEPYPEVSRQVEQISRVLEEEESKFQRALEKGMREIEKVGELNAQVAFQLYETYGFPFELTQEIAKEKNVELTEIDFNAEKTKHAEQSRSASVGMFKGGLQDHSEQTTKYHTATHLLHAALRKVLGTHVQQKGSNITGERLRFDFSHPQAMTEEEKKQVEDQINEWVAQDLPVTKQVMKKEDALKLGAIAFFIEKYPDEVSVYTVGKDVDDDWVSKEFCGGPHVEHTGQIGQLKIQKEQAVSAGVRRIYLV